MIIENLVGSLQIRRPTLRVVRVMDAKAELPAVETLGKRLVDSTAIICPGVVKVAVGDKSATFTWEQGEQKGDTPAPRRAGANVEIDGQKFYCPLPQKGSTGLCLFLADGITIYVVYTGGNLKCQVLNPDGVVDAVTKYFGKEGVHAFSKPLPHETAVDLIATAAAKAAAA